MTTRSLVTLWLSALAVPLVAEAQVPAAVSVPAAIVVGSRVGELPSGYEDGGRRDPFVSLVVPKRTSSPGAADPHPRTGLAAVALVDISVRGVIKNGTAMMAILEGPAGKSFVVRAKDRLLDASIQSIDAAGVVFTETDRSGPAQQIRKALRPAAEDAQ